jgi:DeoR/GlpR family transcriptional regulator of sugar metabolism
MLSEQRYEEIYHLLEREGSVRTITLCDALQTSRETIRRDLENMEAKGMLRRIRGGAMKIETAQEKNMSYTSFRMRRDENFQYKEAVAFEALNYISEGQVIALDSGTTSLFLAKAVKARFRSLTVVTNSFAVAQELAGAEGITLILTGGVYRADEEAFVSDIAALIFSKINVDIFFLTTCEISVERGITYQRMDEISVQNKMMEAAERTIVVADSSKLGTNSLVKMCGIEEISMIITDSGVSSGQVRNFENAGVRVVISKERNGQDDNYTEK